jgi:hypothetical protein
VVQEQPSAAHLHGILAVGVEGGGMPERRARMVGKRATGRAAVGEEWKATILRHHLS